MKVSIIGCGLIGRKRALALSKEDEIIACCDTNRQSAQRFGNEFSCSVYIDYKILLNEIKSDAVIVAVVNKFAKDIILLSLKKGIHVLAEKPLGRNATEAKQIIDTLTGFRTKEYLSSLKNTSNIILKTGFNHRFHPTLWKAKEMADEGKIGKIFSIRARYGHGGRPGMESEWRASKNLCGGGELLDQGIHVIDLIRWFGGEVTEVYGKAETKFWNIEVEDNAYIILKTENDITAAFNVSWTNWKNIFSFEIFGTDGYLKIEGLGGNYGSETLEFGKRKKEGGKPDIQYFEFPSEDVSWKNEWNEFKNAITNNREVIANGYDGLKANEVIEAIYKSNEEKRVIYLSLYKESI